MKLSHIFLLILGAFIVLILLVPGLFFDLIGMIQQIPEPVQTNFGTAMAGIEEKIGLDGNAILLYNRLIQKDPQNPSYSADKGRLEYKNKQYLDALQSYDAALMYDPQNPEYLWKKASLLGILGRNGESSALYDQILALNSTDPASLSILGDVALEKGKYLKAFSYYDQSLARDSQNAAVWEKRGDIIFILLTVPTAAIGADRRLMEEDLYKQGNLSYQNAQKLDPSRGSVIGQKIESRSPEYIPHTIQDLQNRYHQYSYVT